VFLWWGGVFDLEHGAEGSLLTPPLANKEDVLIGIGGVILLRRDLDGAGSQPGAFGGRGGWEIANTIAPSEGPPTVILHWIKMAWANSAGVFLRSPFSCRSQLIGY
jgi:hypothetical protein